MAVKANNPVNSPIKNEINHLCTFSTLLSYNIKEKVSNKPKIRMFEMNLNKELIFGTI